MGDSILSGKDEMEEGYKSLPEKKITQAEWDALPEYSLSLPTDLSVGKQWKTNAFLRGFWIWNIVTGIPARRVISRYRPIISE